MIFFTLAIINFFYADYTSKTDNLQQMSLLYIY